MMGQLLDRRAEGGSILCSRFFFGRLAQIENRVLLRSQKTSEQKKQRRIALRASLSIADYYWQLLLH